MFPILHGILNLTRNFVSKVPNPILSVDQNMDKEKQITNQENEFIICQPHTRSVVLILGVMHKPCSQ